MGVFQVVLKSSWLNQAIRNVFYYETITGNPSTSEWQDIADEIRADFLAEIAAQLVNEFIFEGIDYRDVTSAGLPSFSVVPTAGTAAGSSGGDSVATQVACLVSCKAPTVKPNRARTYFGGMNDASVVQSLILAGTRAAFEAFVGEMSVLNAAGTNELQRVSAQWNTGHTMVVDYNNIAAVTPVASTVPATQRRRRIGVGI